MSRKFLRDDLRSQTVHDCVDPFLFFRLAVTQLLSCLAVATCGRVQSFGPGLSGRCKNGFDNAGKTANCDFKSIFFYIQGQVTSPSVKLPASAYSGSDIRHFRGGFMNGIRRFWPLALLFEAKFYQKSAGRTENNPPFHDGPRASRTSSRVLRNSRCASASFAASLP